MEYADAYFQEMQKQGTDGIRRHQFLQLMTRLSNCEWTEATDERRGTKYYGNTITGESRWEPPSDESVVQAWVARQLNPAFKAAEAARDYDSSSDEDDDLELEVLQDLVTTLDVFVLVDHDGRTDFESLRKRWELLQETAEVEPDGTLDLIKQGFDQIGGTGGTIDFAQFDEVLSHVASLEWDFPLGRRGAKVVLPQSAYARYPS